MAYGFIQISSNVERYRATQIVNQEGDLSCDGQLIKVNQVKIRAHHQILNLFASGINIQQINQL